MTLNGSDADQRLLRLERLAQLRDRGALTPAEFEAEKALVLRGEASGPAYRAAVAPATRPTPADEAEPRRRSFPWIPAAAIVALLSGLATLLFVNTTPTTPGGNAAGRVHRRAPADNALEPMGNASVPDPITAVERGPDLSRALRIDRTCGFGDEGEAIVDALTPRTSDGGSGAVPLRLAGLALTGHWTFRQDDRGAHMDGAVLLPADARWNGLHPTRIAGSLLGTEGALGDGGASKSIAFAEAPTQVRSALAASGVVVPVAPGTAALPDGGTMTLTPSAGGGTRLLCRWSANDG